MLELALRWPLASAWGGEDERPETAESTLVRFSVSADILNGIRVQQESTNQTVLY